MATLGTFKLNMNSPHRRPGGLLWWSRSCSPKASFYAQYLIVIGTQVLYICILRSRCVLHCLYALAVKTPYVSRMYI